MKTTKQLSKDLVKLQEEAKEKILSFLKKGQFENIRFFKKANHLTIEFEREDWYVNRIHSNGEIDIEEREYDTFKSKNLSDLSIDALLTILDELERMKKANLLKKP